MLRLSICGQSHNHWYEHLSTIENIINDLEHSNTLISSKELQFGEPISDELAILLNLRGNQANIEKRIEIEGKRPKEQAARADNRA